MSDTTAGLNCFGALGYALFHRERTGIGQHVDISLVDTMLQNHELGMTAYAVSDGAYVPKRIGRHHPLVCPCGVYRGPEYWIVLLCMDNQWPYLCEAMGQPGAGARPPLLYRPAAGREPGGADRADRGVDGRAGHRRRRPGHLRAAPCAAEKVRTPSTR